MSSIIWNHIPKTSKETGYEDVLDLLSKYTPEAYKEANDVEKEKMIDDVFQIYRSKNIFPITYYNDDGIQKEIKSCFDKEIKWDNSTGVLNLGFNQGQSLCRFLFPCLYNVDVTGRIKNNSPYYKFMDDNKLKKAIKFVLVYKKNGSVTPSRVKDGLEMIDGNVPSNFKTMNAKALYQHFTKPGDIVLDFSAGFGGRMLGAMSAGVHYIGIEPSTEAYKCLNVLGEHIMKYNNRSTKCKIINSGSEEQLPIMNECIDFAFSSPPYFNLEIYCDEDTQCYNKFNELESWFSGYVEPTIQNIHRCLKQGSYYAVNIADFKTGKNEVKYVDRWIELSEKNGFEFVQTISMSLQSRRGDGHDEKNKKTKKEGIFVFKKI